MRKCIFTIVLIAVLCSLLIGCATKTDAPSVTAAPEKIYKIGVLAPNVTHGWVAAISYYAEECLKTLDKQVEYKILTSKDIGEMTMQFTALEQWGAEAIVAFPQWPGLEAAAKNAIEKGIKIVSFDQKIEADGIYHIAGNNEEIGLKSAEYIVEKIGMEGTVALLDVPGAGSVSALRKQGFLDKIKELAPDIKIETINTKFSREDGERDFAAMLKKVSKIDAVFSMDDETSIGVLNAVKTAGRKDIKVVTGGGGMQEYFKMMQEETEIYIESTLYSPKMVQDAINISLKILKDDNVSAETIIPTSVIDKDNCISYIDGNPLY